MPTKYRGSKNIVSLDLWLYSKPMQLRSRHEIHEEVLFCLGELHTVFTMLKVIGKYIKESGLDKILLILKFMEKPP